jgi:K+-transporting ATPase KdpF subunit
MSRRKPAPDLIRGGHRFADKDMRQQMKRLPMIFDYSLAALVTAGLMIYLVYALLRPEQL